MLLVFPENKTAIQPVRAGQGETGWDGRRRDITQCWMKWIEPTLGFNCSPWHRLFILKMGLHFIAQKVENTSLHFFVYLLGNLCIKKNWCSSVYLFVCWFIRLYVSKFACLDVFIFILFLRGGAAMQFCYIRHRILDILLTIEKPACYHSHADQWEACQLTIKCGPMRREPAINDMLTN